MYKKDDVVVLETVNGFYIGKIDSIDNDSISMMKVASLTMVPISEMPPEMQAKIRNNPNAFPIGMGSFPPFYDTSKPIKFLRSQVITMGLPGVNVEQLYTKKMSGIVIPNGPLPKEPAVGRPLG